MPRISNSRSRVRELQSEEICGCRDDCRGRQREWIRRSRLDARDDAIARQHGDAHQGRQDQGVHLSPDHAKDSRDEHPRAEPRERLQRLAIDELRRDTQIRTEDSCGDRVSNRGEQRPRDHRHTKGNHTLSGEQDDEREHGVQDLPRQVDHLDPAILLEALKGAEKRESGEPEERLDSEEDEQEVEVVLQRGSVDIREDVTREHRQREEDRGSNHAGGSEDRQRRADRLPDAPALATTIGVRDKTCHAGLQAEVGNAEEPGRQREGESECENAKRSCVELVDGLADDEEVGEQRDDTHHAREQRVAEDATSVRDRGGRDGHVRRAASRWAR